MTPGLRRYLDLEDLMLKAEGVDEAAADALRDVMDRVWYGLTADDRRLLDERRIEGPIRVLECVHLPEPSSLLRPPARAAKKPHDHKPILNWRRPAA
jgi:hypothetical protein